MDKSIIRMIQIKSHLKIYIYKPHLPTASLLPPLLLVVSYVFSLVKIGRGWPDPATYDDRFIFYFYLFLIKPCCRLQLDLTNRDRIWLLPSWVARIRLLAMEKTILFIFYQNRPSPMTGTSHSPIETSNDDRFRPTAT